MQNTKLLEELFFLSPKWIAFLKGERYSKTHETLHTFHTWGKFTYVMVVGNKQGKMTC